MEKKYSPARAKVQARIKIDFDRRMKRINP